MTPDAIKQQLFEDLKNQDDWRIRRDAVDKLRDYESDDAINALLPLLYDENPHVVERVYIALESKQLPKNVLIKTLYDVESTVNRYWILILLGDLHDDNLIKHFIHFIDSEDHSLIHASILALKRIENKSLTLPHLLKTLTRNDISVENIKYLIESIGDIRAPETISLIASFLTHTDESIGRQAAWALAKIGTEDSTNILLSAMKTTTSRIRKSIIQALGHISSDIILNQFNNVLEIESRLVYLEILGKTQRPEALRILKREFDKGNRKDISALRIAFGYTGKLEAIAPLLNIYVNDVTHETLGLQIFCSHYWRFNERKAFVMSALKQFLQSNYDPQRIAALLLFRFESDTDLIDFQIENIELFQSALNDNNPAIRLSALLGLQSQSYLLLQDEIIQMTSDKYSYVQESVITVLECIPTPQAMNALMNMVHTEQGEIQHKAIFALGKTWKKESKNLCLELLNHEDKMVRFFAIKGLKQQSDLDVIDALIERFYVEPIPKVRAVIIKSLPHQSDSKSLQLMLEILREEDEYNYLDSPFDMALLVVASFNSDESIPVLEHILDSSPRWDRRMYAVASLARIGSPIEITERLFGFLYHTDSITRTASARELGYLGARIDNLILRDRIVKALIEKLDDNGIGFHASPTVASMTSKSLWYIGTSESRQASEIWRESNQK